MRLGLTGSRDPLHALAIGFAACPLNRAQQVHYADITISDLRAVKTSNSNFALPLLGVVLLIALAATLLFGKVRSGPAPGLEQEGWRATTPFQIPRRALAAAATASHVYVIGGMDNEDRYVAAVEYAAILADGRLGSWHFTAPLGEPRFYLAAAVSNGYLYAIGGANGERGKDNIPSATVERAPILADGSLGPWQRAAYLTTPRRGLQAVAHDNHLYAIGGYNGAFLKSTEHTRINAEGELTEWQLDAQQAVVDRYIHSATHRGDKLYLLGGHMRGAESMSYGDVEMSTLNTDGGLTPWQIQKSILLTPRFIASAFAMNDYIYMLGGHDGGNRLRSVEFAPLDTRGGVGAWSAAAPLVEGRSATALAVNGDRVYVFGGMGHAGALNSVEMAGQLTGGRLGYRRGE